MDKKWKENIIAQVKQELEDLETRGKEAKDIVELEALMMKFSTKFTQEIWEEWMKERAEGKKFSSKMLSMWQNDEQATVKV